MISIEEIKKRIIKKQDLLVKKTTYEAHNVFSFWDLDEDKQIVMRFIGVRLTTRGFQSSKIIYAIETARYYPEGKTMKSWKWKNTSVWSRERIEGEFTAHLFDFGLDAPSGFRWTWQNEFSVNNPNLMHINLTKKGKPYNLYNSVRKGELFFAIENIKGYTFDYTEIDEIFLTKKEKNKVRQYRIKDIKSERTLLELIDGNNRWYRIPQLHNYLQMFKKYKGLYFIWKNGLIDHLKQNFLNKVIINDTPLFKLKNKNNIQDWYINLVKTDLDKARQLNITNVLKVFKGESIFEIKKKKIFRLALGQIKAEKAEVKYLGKGKKEYNLTDTQQFLLKTLSDNLYQLPLFKKMKEDHYITSPKDKLEHLYDYLEYRMLDHELTPGIILNPHWEEDFEMMRGMIQINKQKAPSRDHLTRLVKDKSFERLDMKSLYNYQQIEEYLNRYPEFVTEVLSKYPNYLKNRSKVIKYINEKEKTKEKRVVKEMRKANTKIEEKIIEFAEFIGIEETELKKGENVNKYKLHAPENFENYNKHAKELNQCIYNNTNHARKHVELNDVLIFIERNGETFATATLKPDGTIVGFKKKQREMNNEDKTDDVVGIEKTELSKLMLDKFLPKILELKNKEQGVIQ